MNNLTKNMKALYVSAFLPDEFAPHAGGQAAFNNRRDLETAGYEVTSLICTTELISEGQVDQKTYVVHQTLFSACLGYLANALSLRMNYLLAWPVLDTRSNIKFEKLLRYEIQNGEYDLLFVDFTQVMLPVVRIVKRIGKGQNTCACAHDLFVQKMLRGEGVLTQLLTGPVVRAERDILRNFDEVVTLSDKDQALAKQLYDLKNVRARPWSAPRWTRDVKRKSKSVQKAEILFFCNFQRPENAEAANWLLLRAWPVIKQAVPDATLVLAGAGSDSVKLPIGVEGVRRTGFVQNPSEYFTSCELAIAPIIYGAGVKFKVLEALACGVTVVGTTVALEGVPRNNLTIEVERDMFADAVIDLLANNKICSTSSDHIGW